MKRNKLPRKVRINILIPAVQLDKYGRRRELGHVDYSMKEEPIDNKAEKSLSTIKQKCQQFKRPRTFAFSIQNESGSETNVSPKENATDDVENKDLEVPTMNLKEYDVKKVDRKNEDKRKHLE
ncbi:hypothetical protein Trydic_g589 [Trypoxylus dichotomus]